MKYILIAFILLTFKAEAQKKERYFLIGWVGWDSTNNRSIGGGYDTTMYKDPNLIKFQNFFKKKFKMHDVYLYSVTEYKWADREEFYNEEKKK
jgi:hypothetical protein